MVCSAASASVGTFCAEGQCRLLDCHTRHSGRSAVFLRSLCHRVHVSYYIWHMWVAYTMPSGLRLLLQLACVDASSKSYVSGYRGAVWKARAALLDHIQLAYCGRGAFVCVLGMRVSTPPGNVVWRPRVHRSRGSPLRPTTVRAYALTHSLGINLRVGLRAVGGACVTDADTGPLLPRQKRGGHLQRRQARRVPWRCSVGGAGAASVLRGIA